MQLNLPNLKLGLSDLLDKREQDLLRTDAGKYYRPRLVETQKGIDELPPILTGGAPLAALLAEADAGHDGYGGAIYFTTEVYLRLPDATPKQVEAAKRIRAELIPELDELTRPYAIEAHKAIERKPRLQELKNDLKLFPVGEKETLYDVAKKFLEAGERIHELLSSRADVPKTSRKDAAVLRSRAVGLLFKLREDVKEEVARSPKLPRDLEHRIFGYIDTLYDMQARAQAAKATAAAKGSEAASAPEAVKDAAGTGTDAKAPQDPPK